MIRWLEHAIFTFMTGYKFTLYLPDLDWDSLDQSLGMPQLGRHVLTESGKSHKNEDVHDETLSDIVRSVLGISRDDFSPLVPLTSYGMDSLSAAKLSFSLRSLVEVTQMQLLADMSLNDLRLRIEWTRTAESRTSYSIPNISEAVPSLDPAVEMLNKYLVTYKALQPTIRENSPEPESHDLTILLTGSTGSLGCNILHLLLQREDVKRVYALNRRKECGLSLHERQEAALECQGLPTSHMKSSKLLMVEGVFTREDFGLSEDLLSEVSTANKFSQNPLSN